MSFPPCWACAWVVTLFAYKASRYSAGRKIADSKGQVFLFLSLSHTKLYRRQSSVTRCRLLPLCLAILNRRRSRQLLETTRSRQNTRWHLITRHESRLFQNYIRPRLHLHCPQTSSRLNSPIMPAKKLRCNTKDCREAAQRIVGDCTFCNGHFCGKHRLLEDHKCSGLEDVSFALQNSLSEYS